MNRPGLPIEPGGPDLGLQPERTRLAWRRTVLTVTAVAVLLCRYAIHRGLSGGALLTVAATAIVWLALVLVAQRRIRVLAERPPAVVSTIRTALVATTVVAFVLLSGLVLADSLTG